MLKTKTTNALEPEVQNFIDNIDDWIKQLRSEFNEFRELPAVVEENMNNIQHNYELIFELKDRVEKLTKEVEALKIIQLAALKLKVEKKN